MKHLQLNTSTLRNPQKIIQFVLENNIDVTCLSEICYATGSENPIAKLAQENNLNYVEGIHFYYLPDNQTIGTAVISKFPIIDHFCLYFNSNDYYPKKIESDPLSDTSLINDITNVHKDTIFPGSRGLKHSVKSRCILCVTIQTPTTLLRVINTQFTVSDLCTETIQMLEMSKLINSLVTHSKNLPTILSGDLNIRAQSYSVSKLSEVLTCHTLNLKDSLSSTHPAKKKDFPDGLAIDHVFSKNLKHQSTETIEINFSDHKAIVSEFTL